MVLSVNTYSDCRSSMTQPSKLDRKTVVAINRRHQSNKQKLRNAARKAK